MQIAKTANPAIHLPVVKITFHTLILFRKLPMNDAFLLHLKILFVACWLKA